MHNLFRAEAIQSKYNNRQWRYYEWGLLMAAGMLCLGVAGLSYIRPVTRGLIGQYYLNSDWRGVPWNHARDVEISHHAPTFQEAMNASPNGQFSVEWRGYLEFARTDKGVKFWTNSDDGSWLWIDDHLVVDNGGSHGLQEVRGAVAMAPGLHTIRIRYLQTGGSAALQVFWEKESNQRVMLTAEALLPANTVNFLRAHIMPWREWLFIYGILFLVILLLIISSNPNKTLLIIGSCLFIGSQLYIVTGSMKGRFLPVEVDDAYSYIIKAVEMQEGYFRQDSPALNDLRQQLIPVSSDDAVNAQRYRQYHRIFFIYHPLHSLILWGLHSIGYSWEHAYDIIRIIGSIGISIGIIWWLNAVWGNAVTGITEILLAFVIFSGQGIHYVVPNNLALGLGLFAWGYASRCKSPKSWIIFLFLLSMMLMHPVGRLYGIIFLGIGLYIRQFSQSSVRITMLGLGCIALSFIMPLLIDRPELRMIADPYPPHFTFGQGVRENLAAIPNVLRNTSIVSPIFYLLSFVGTIIGVKFLTSRQRKIVRMNLLCVLGLLVVSVGHILPHYPGTVVERMSIPVIILLTGSVGVAIWISFIEMKKMFIVMLEKIIARRLFCLMPILFVVLITILGSSIYGGRLFFLKKIHNANITIENMKTIQNHLFDMNQPRLLLSSILPQESVLYKGEIPLYAYLSYGLLKYGAVDYNAVAGTPEEAYWIRNNTHLGYLVTVTPLSKFPHQQIPLTSSDYLSVEMLSHHQGSSLFLDIVADNEMMTTLVCNFEDVDGHKIFETSYDFVTKWQGKLQIHLPNMESIASIKLSIPNRTASLRITGIRTASNSHLRWPWDQGITLRYKSNSLDENIRFLSTDLLPNAIKPFEVISDTGYTVLCKFVN